MKEDRLLKKYNISAQQLSILYTEQEGRCAICADFIAFGGTVSTSVAIDHDHETGQIRGLLCPRCNSLLGFARDSTIILNNAVKYLIAYKKGRLALRASQSPN